MIESVVRDFQPDLEGLRFLHGACLKRFPADQLAPLRLCWAEKAEADKFGWEYSKLRGDLRLIRMLLNAEWDPKDFLVVQPGQRIVARYDADVIHAERGEEAP